VVQTFAERGDAGEGLRVVAYLVSSNTKEEASHFADGTKVFIFGKSGISELSIVSRPGVEFPKMVAVGAPVAPGASVQLPKGRYFSSDRKRAEEGHPGFTVVSAGYGGKVTRENVSYDEGRKSINRTSDRETTGTTIALDTLGAVVGGTTEDAREGLKQAASKLTSETSDLLLKIAIGYFVVTSFLSKE